MPEPPTETPHPDLDEPADTSGGDQPEVEDRPEVTVRAVAGSNPSMQHRTLGRADLDEVVDAARQGDREAFDELVRRTHADTYSLARRLVSDPDDARDVVQEAYLRAYRSIRKFRGDAQFSTWMHRITANCASTHLGRRRRHRHDELDEEVAVTDLNPERDPEAQADASLLRHRLEAAIAELPPRLRAVVVLRDVYDLGHAEIAESLGISESAAKVRLHRARRKLRSVVFPMRDDVPVELEEDEARAV